MKGKKRHIISWFMLLPYMALLAHAFIPHHHGDSPEHHGHIACIHSAHAHLHLHLPDDTGCTPEDHDHDYHGDCETLNHTLLKNLSSRSWQADIFDAADPALFDLCLQVFDFYTPCAEPSLTRVSYDDAAVASAYIAPSPVRGPPSLG